jgi:hypothetical protein
VQTMAWHRQRGQSAEGERERSRATSGGRPPARDRTCIMVRSETQSFVEVECTVSWA